MLGETTLRTYIKPKLFDTYAREKVNLLSFFQRQYFYCTFQYTYTECCFGDCLEYIDRCLFPAKEKKIYIYVVLGLGSTDDVLLTSICLRKPHLEHKKKRSCLPHMQEIYIYIYVFFRLRFYGPCFLICTHLLGETTLRTYVKPKLFATYAREKVNLLSFFQRQYFYCTFQYTYTECCFGDCLEYIDRYLFPAKEKYICCFRPRFYGRCSFDQHLLEEATLRT